MKYLPPNQWRPRQTVKIEQFGAFEYKFLLSKYFASATLLHFKSLAAVFTFG